MTTRAGHPVVAVLAEEWQALATLASGLSDEQWETASECPGWTVRDLVAHLIGTERALLGEAPPGPPDTAPAHVRNAVGALNESWVAARRSLSGSAVLAELCEVTARRLAQLSSSPSSRFDEVGPSPVGEVPYAEFMQVRVMDCWVHEQDIRLCIARPGHRRGPAPALALGRLLSALPFVVGKQAAAPDGSRVRFDFVGPWCRRVDVVVEDRRARALPEPDGVPTVTLRMGADTFCRLTCGRLTGDAARGAGLVEVEGDDLLARQIVDAMAFMI